MISLQLVENMLSKDNYISKNQRPIARTRNKVCSPDLTKNETSMKCEIAAVFRVRIVIIFPCTYRDYFDCIADAGSLQNTKVQTFHAEPNI